jgi:lysophospholipase L1-like esterase
MYKFSYKLIDVSVHWNTISGQIFNLIMIDDLFLTLALSPVLVLQGIYTRKVTPKLPEPVGRRDGVEDDAGWSDVGVCDSDSLKVLILGDSAAAGVGVDEQRYALSGQLMSKLAKHRKVEWRLEAETGLNTQEVLDRLYALDAFETDVVVVSLGVNDVTGGTRLKHWLRQQQELKQVLQNKFQASHIFLSSVPPMHEFPALPQPLRWFLGRRSTAMNVALNDYASQDDVLAFVTVAFPMDKDYFASDGFHPSAKAYKLWSNILLEHFKERGLLS